MSEACAAIPLTPLRKVIAARMAEAKQTIPHFRVQADIAMDALMALRGGVNAAACESSDSPGPRVSLNDFIIKACAGALMEAPEMNIQFVDGEIRQFRQADISIVIAVDGGLATPIIRAADRKSVAEISAEVQDFASRAAKGQLKMQEITGGSFSISNLGMHGADAFDAIINPPQGAILALGAASPAPVVRDGKLATAMIMRATLSLDHRVLDGVTGAHFLSVLRQKLECPERLMASKKSGRKM